MSFSDLRNEKTAFDRDNDRHVQSLSRSILQLQQNNAVLERQLRGVRATDLLPPHVRRSLLTTVTTTRRTAQDAESQLKMCAERLHYAEREASDGPESVPRRRAKLQLEKLTRQLNAELSRLQTVAKSIVANERHNADLAAGPDDDDNDLESGGALEERSLLGGGLGGPHFAASARSAPSSAHHRRQHPAHGGNATGIGSGSDAAAVSSSTSSTALTDVAAGFDLRTDLMSNEEEDERAFQQEFNLQLQQDIALERQQGIERVQRQVLQVNEIFRDLAGIVQEQGIMLSTLDQHIEETAQTAKKATQELSKASKHQAAARARKCCLLLLFAAAIFVLALFLTITFKV